MSDLPDTWKGIEAWCKANGGEIQATATADGIRVTLTLGSETVTEDHPPRAFPDEVELAAIFRRLRDRLTYRSAPH